MNDNPQDILDAFEKFAGAEGFRKFVRAIDWEPSSQLRKELPGLFFWQEDLWNAFKRDCESYEVPTEYGDIVALFSNVSRPQPGRLNRWEVPEWCEIEEVHNGCPLQIWGKCFERPWYFRARSSHWSLELSCMTEVPAQAFVGGVPDAYRIEGTYGEGVYSYPYMPEEEGIYLIATGLEKLLFEAGIRVNESTA